MWIAVYRESRLTVLFQHLPAKREIRPLLGSVTRAPGRASSILNRSNKKFEFQRGGERPIICPMPKLRLKKCHMKTSILIVLAIASLIPSALAQDRTDYSDQAPHAATGMSSKPLMVSGKVSPDGKALLGDIDSEWIIDNPEALKGQEGRRVTVKCYVDTEKSRLKILRVKKEDAERKYAAKHDDSAFRR